MSGPANIINHIVLVLDASSSMQRKSSELIKVADNQIAYLAQRSKELDQETRITVYSFGSDRTYESSYGRTNFRRPPAKIECLVYDKDVLRVPSIAQVYHAWGNTPLIDATVLALDDLAQTPEKYGEHSFLVYVLTDGKENDSQVSASMLAGKIADLPDHWTLAAFVPDQTGVYEAKRFGFPAQNIAVWDVNSAAGVEEVGGEIRRATENFMQARAHAHKTGTKFRGTRSLFSLENPSLAQVSRNLTPLSDFKYHVFPVHEPSRIDDFVVKHTGRGYQVGKAFYQLSKREEIQPQKQVAIRSKHGEVYVGDDARNLLGLPDYHIKVSPSYNKDYDIFVQSTSINRKLVPNTELLVLS